MKFIGLLMISGEDDILERVIAEHEKVVDAFYVLDGTQPNDVSESICIASPKCCGYITDADIPHPQFPDNPVDGWRQVIYEMACDDAGWDNWFLVLHGDEIWTVDPAKIVNKQHDGYIFQLPFYFPRAGEEWDQDVHPLDQLKWNLGPGYPEFRMFKGGRDVRYIPGQHFDTQPVGIQRSIFVPFDINHYLYRSPEQQIARAARHEETEFDPDNYKHITNGNAVYWTDEMIADHQRSPYFRELRYG